MVPVIEAGGGVAEGFEPSERQLIENVEDRAVYGRPTTSTRPEGDED